MWQALGWGERDMDIDIDIIFLFHLIIPMSSSQGRQFYISHLRKLRCREIMIMVTQLVNGRVRIRSFSQCQKSPLCSFHKSIQASQLELS